GAEIARSLGLVLMTRLTSEPARYSAEGDGGGGFGGLRGRRLRWAWWGHGNSFPAMASGGVRPELFSLHSPEGREAEGRLRVNESSPRCSFRRKLVRQLRPLLQDQLAHGATHLHAFGREQLHVDPFLLLGCKDLPSDDAELIRALVGQRHGLALLGAFRCLGDPHP